MILHDNLSSGNGYKVRLLLLAQLGLPFRRIEYNIDRGETRTPEFLKGFDPNGRIPVLQTDEGALFRVRRDPARGAAGTRQSAAMDVLRAVQPLFTEHPSLGSAPC